MKPNKSNNSIVVVLHIVASVAIMMIALFTSEAVSDLLSTSVLLDDLISTVVYIGITLSVGLLYAKHILAAIK